MYTLLVSAWELPASRALGAAARAGGGRVYSLEETPSPEISGPVAFWGGGEAGVALACRYRLALLEPPFDLLARLPYFLRMRTVEFGMLRDLSGLTGPVFVKPADSVRKVFDAGVYGDPGSAEALRTASAETPVLLSEPVEWLAEYRCFVRERKLAAVSPYVSFGVPSWRPYVPKSGPVRVPPQVPALCERLFTELGSALPPAFVVDVGLIHERGWAVVEFNPAWCSGLLGADPRAVLPVLRRATRDQGALARADRRWVVERPRGK